MNRFILTIIIAFCAIMSLKAQETYFPYPQVPDNLGTLEARTTFLVSHFWERCDIKSALSSRDKFKKAFSDYVSFMPYADTDTIRESVTALINSVKKSPKDMLTLGQIAEETLYGDSAMMWSDELYLPFAQAVVDTKKISSTDKARFQHHVNILKHSQLGMIIPSLKVYDRDGKKTTIDTISTPLIILFFNDPECDDCAIAKARLSANIKANQLIKDGKLTVISIYPGDADNEWKDAAKSYPAQWIAVAAPDADSYFDMRMTPSLYILNRERRIIAKNMDINGVITSVSVYN